MDFEPEREEWCAYRLTDGGRVRVRATASRIFRVVDDEGKPIYAPDGSPSVIVTNQITVVSSEG